MPFNVEVGTEAAENSNSEAAGRLNNRVADAMSQKDCEVLPERAGAAGEDWGTGDDWSTQQLFAQAQREQDFS
jgi:hypothetical protein